MSDPNRTSWWINEEWRNELPSEEAVIASACQYLLVKDVVGAVPLLIASEVRYREPRFFEGDTKTSAQLPVVPRITVFSSDPITRIPHPG
jgi:hypothetical protein